MVLNAYTRSLGGVSGVCVIENNSGKEQKNKKEGRNRMSVCSKNKGWQYRSGGGPPQQQKKDQTSEQN